MKSVSRTIENQIRLGNYARTGLKKPKTSIDENTYQYRRLVYNNIEDTITNAFPLSYRYIGKRIWNGMVKEFIQNHPAGSPQLWKLPLEFIEYFEINFIETQKVYPCLHNLLLLEWSEVEVFMMDDIVVPYKSTGNMESDKLVLNPEIRFYVMEYPVYKKEAKDISNDDKGMYFLTAHRHDQNKQVLYNEFGPEFIQILFKMEENNLSLNEIKSWIPTKSEIEITQFLNFCLEQRIILGFQ